MKSGIPILSVKPDGEHEDWFGTSDKFFVVRVLIF